MDSFEFQLITEKRYFETIQVSCRFNHLITELSGSLTFSFNEIRSACILTHAEYDTWSCILILRLLLRNYNWNVCQWHQAVNLTPNTLITLNLNIYQGWLVNLPQSQVTMLFHWCARWAPQTLQVTALMTVLHVCNKNSSLAAVPHSVCYKSSFW